MIIDNVIFGFFMGLIIGFIVSRLTDSDEVGGAPNTIISTICAVAGLIIAVVAS